MKKKMKKKIKLLLRNNFQFISEIVLWIIALIIIVSNLFNPLVLALTPIIGTINIILLKSIDKKIKVEILNPIERKVLEEIKSRNSKGIPINELPGIIHTYVLQVDRREIERSIKEKKFIKKKKNKYFLSNKAEIQL